MMDEPFEFAAELTFRERVWMIVRGLAIGGAILLVWHLWLNPEIKEFAASASCRTIFGVNGIAYVWYGVAVGVPLFGFF